jgi:hypothetical protein
VPDPSSKLVDVQTSGKNCGTSVVPVVHIDLQYRVAGNLAAVIGVGRDACNPLEDTGKMEDPLASYRGKVEHMHCESGIGRVIVLEGLPYETAGSKQHER